MMRRTERFAVGERPRLDVQLPSGSIEVREGEPGTIVVEIEAAEDDVVLTHVGDVVSARHPSKWGWRSRSVRLLATVPAGTEVELASASADLRVHGSLGVVRLRTASGRIEADTTERLEVHTASGDIRIREVAGDCVVYAVSGECVAGTIGGRLTGTSVSGDVRVEAVGGDLRIGTTSGDIRVDRCDGDEVALKSVSGGLEVGLPAGIHVEADLTTMSGRAKLPDTERSGSPVARAAGPKRTVRLTLRTVSGDITVRRVGAG